MAALACCIEVSLEMGAQRQKIDAGAIDLPHRSALFEGTVQFQDVADQKDGARLVQQAQKISTVSASPKAEVTLRPWRERVMP